MSNIKDVQILAIETPTPEDLTMGGGQFDQFVAPFLPSEVVRIDLARLPAAQQGISYKQDEYGSQVYFGSQRLHPTAAYLSLGVEWVFDEILSQTLADRKLRPDQIDTARRAVRAHGEALLAEFSDIPWINPYAAMLNTSHRPLTLRDAQRCGIDVARAIQTGDPDEARRFVYRELTRDGCVFKSPIKMVWTPKRRWPWQPKPRQMWLSTRRILPGTQPDYDSLALGPLIFQQYVPGRRIRVNIIMCPPRPEVRAAQAVMPPGWELDDTICDHRIVDHTYAPFKLPSGLEERCVELLRRKGLLRAELDFNLTAEGRYVLVDVNEDGRWGFLEEELDNYPIGRAIARLLLAGSQDYLATQ